MTGGSLTAARTCPTGCGATVRTPLERAGAEAKNAAAFNLAVLAKLQKLKRAVHSARRTSGRRTPPTGGSGKVFRAAWPDSSPLGATFWSQVVSWAFTVTEHGGHRSGARRASHATRDAALAVSDRKPWPSWGASPW